jgi:SAM-dependent methyltransferase
MLSKPAQVSMGEAWFEIAKPEHFWFVRRFEVLRKLWRPSGPSASFLEIGCGNGVLQRQFEDAFDSPMDGADLHLESLQRNLSRRGKLYCYDIFEQRADLLRRYDGIMLFDVLEHLTEPGEFLRTALQHLKPGGECLIHVPAGQWLFSAYDEAVGHQRRYSIRSLQALCESAGLTVERASYWGICLIPLLVIRKWLMGKAGSKESTIEKGMRPRSSLADRWLLRLSRLDFLPQTIVGTSILVVAKSSGARSTYE